MAGAEYQIYLLYLFSRALLVRTESKGTRYLSRLTSTLFLSSCINIYVFVLTSVYIILIARGKLVLVSLVPEERGEIQGLE